jgi:hypothetical protein
MPPARMEAVIREAGRTPAQRTTLYAAPDERQRMKSYRAQPLIALTRVRAVAEAKTA